MKNVEKMPDKRIHFIGILSNVDKSILQVKLDHGFIIDAFSSEEGMRFFSELERILEIFLVSMFLMRFLPITDV